MVKVEIAMSKIPIRIPKLSIATHEATLLHRIVADGQAVDEGDALYLLETEKVETEVESPAGGVVRWTSEPGTTYDVGTEIGYLESPD
jgi:pyruvate/2-oxoglutarate dehydrogenase complex dihydrolipoamide acyltransferase (E2) component